MSIPDDFDWVDLNFSDVEGVDRRVAGPGWEIPARITAEPGYLVFSIEPGKKVHPKRGMLTGFVELAEITETPHLLKYAQHWGPLGLCKEHLRPYTHLRSRVCQRDYVAPLGGYEDGTIEAVLEPPIEFREPVSAWINHAQRARAILNMCARIGTGERPRKEDLEMLGLPGAPPRSGKIADEFLNRWLDGCQVQPICQFHTQQQRLRIDLKAWPPLFGALGIQMIFAASRTEGFAICSACGRSFLPSRRPNPNRRTYCEQCRNRARWRDADRDRRRRKTAARLRAEGLTYARIAGRLGVNVETAILLAAKSTGSP